MINGLSLINKNLFKLFVIKINNNRKKNQIYLTFFQKNKHMIKNNKYNVKLKKIYIISKKLIH